MKRVTERVGNLQLSLRQAHQEIDALKADVQKGSDREARLQAKMGVLREEAVNAKCQNEADLKNKIIQLEAEVGKQRQRCLTIIEEKEDEVAHLKSAMETTIEMAFRYGATTTQFFFSLLFVTPHWRGLCSLSFLPATPFSW